ncbi:MAG: hypothetical protein RQ732_09830, partial [Methylophaga sp.]|nr:hypothetical protein [Methylophaga sp.]
LKQSGLFGQINQTVKSLPEDDEVRIAWENAQSFTRVSPTMLAMAQQFNLTESQLDDLFDLAAQVEI